MFKFLKRIVENKRGLLENFLPVIITFIATVVVLAIGINILGTFQVTAGATNGSTLGGNAAYNITGNGVAGMSQISSYLPIIGLVLVAALIIGVLLTAFSFKSA